MAELNTIRNNVADEVRNTEKLAKGAGAGILGSEIGQSAMALRERLEGVKKQGAANIENAKAQKKETEGQQNVQQGGAQQKIGETMVATGTALVAAGPFTIWPGLALIATGSGVSLMGSNQRQQGQQQVEEAPAYQSKANDLSDQSDTHFSTAQQLQSEAEATQQDAAPDDPNGAKTQGQQTGYFIGDNLADASSSDEDESTIAKLRDGADTDGGIGGTSNDKELVADASSGGADDTNKTLADKLKDSSKTIAAMTGNIDIDDATQSL
jgi:hypothetical protein